MNCWPSVTVDAANGEAAQPVAGPNILILPPCRWENTNIEKFFGISMRWTSGKVT